MGDTMYNKWGLASAHCLQSTVYEKVRPWTAFRCAAGKGEAMDQPIRSVEIISDGILVAFSDGTRCYFPASFLLSQVGVGSNQVFLTYDQAALPLLGAPSIDPITSPLLS